MATPPINPIRLLAFALAGACFASFAQAQPEWNIIIFKNTDGLYRGEVEFMDLNATTVDALFPGGDLNDFELWDEDGHFGIESDWCATLAEVLTDTNGTWQITIDRGLATQAVYTFDFDNNAIQESLFPIMPTITFPSEGQRITNPRPTLTWNSNGASATADALAMSLDGDAIEYFDDSYTGELSLTQTQWTPPDDLLPAWYKFDVYYAAIVPGVGTALSYESGLYSTELDNLDPLCLELSGDRVEFYFLPALQADFNGDGIVDVIDLGILAGGWQNPAIHSEGDANLDGFVDVIDLGILAGEWQQTAVTPASEDLQIPEAATFIMLFAAASTLIRRSAVKTCKLRR